MMQSSLSILSLDVCLALCGYLSYLCFTSPHPPPARLYKHDRLMGREGHDTQSRYIGMGIFVWHAVFISFPGYRTNICLNPDLVNPALTAWNWYTGFFVIVILASASVRLQAYAGLGKNFTFLLAEPDKLITTGIYHYVQHPSYISLMLMNYAWYWTFLRLDGVPACFLPSWLVSIKALAIVPSIVATVLTFLGLKMRVKDEEEMLKKAFGKDWEIWHAKTARFIPGVY